MGGMVLNPYVAGGLAFLVSLSLLRGCSPAQAPRIQAGAPLVESQEPAAPSTPEAAPAPPVIDFAAQVQPILQNHCSPCHFEGGKMYTRLPFDDPRTLRDHAAGILPRIKSPEERTTLEAFLAQEAKGEPEG